MKKFFSVVTMSVVGVALLAGCTTDGGAQSMPAPTITQPTEESTNTMTSMDLSQYITISGALGAEPQISAPKGNPPAELVFQDLAEGDGTAALSSSTLTVHYKLLTWSDGKIADSSWTSGNPATFPLANVVKGWQEGLPGMKVGGRRLLIVPPSLGYGSADYGPIKGNETLVFVVDLIDVK
ncbi:unannotated protein [freshwater metagenome]|uniref:peptidylprolyl isomerase n=1 Tax=freshwater metagenome TaxID=449393 RepID=A0A6J6FT39_9ZZZZ